MQQRTELFAWEIFYASSEAVNEFLGHWSHLSACYLMMLFSFCKSGDTDKGLTVWKFGQASTSTSCHEHRHGFLVPLPFSSSSVFCDHTSYPVGFISVCSSLGHVGVRRCKMFFPRLSFSLHWCCGVLETLHSCKAHWVLFVASSVCSGTVPLDSTFWSPPPHLLLGMPASSSWHLSIHLVPYRGTY